MLPSYTTSQLPGFVLTIARGLTVDRLYGDKAQDVVQALQRDPYGHIPIIVKRLRQKHEEWRSAQRQWNQIWREIHEKNYMRSLDYQATQFKKADPHRLRPKQLLERMVTLRDEYLEVGAMCLARHSLSGPVSKEPEEIWPG